MAENTTIVSLGQLVDLSINVKDGTIDFQILQVLLHITMQQVGLTDVAVEFRGTDSQRIQELIKWGGTKPPAEKAFNQYAVTGGPKKKRKRTVSLNDIKTQDDKLKKLQAVEEAREKEIRTIERRKDSKVDPDLNPQPLKSPTTSIVKLVTEGEGAVQSQTAVQNQSTAPSQSVIKSQSAVKSQSALKSQSTVQGQSSVAQGQSSVAQGQSAVQGQSMVQGQNMVQGQAFLQNQTVVVVDSSSNLPQFSVAISKDVFDSILDDIANLKRQQKELAELPGNFGLIEATRNTTGPILDMFQILTLTKRVEAAEEGMEKFSSLLEDLFKNPALLGSGADSGALKQIEERVTNLENLFKPVGEIMDESKPTEPVEGEVEETDESATEEKADPTTSKSQTGGRKVFAPSAFYVSCIQGVNLDEIGPAKALFLMQQEFDRLRQWICCNLIDIEDIKGKGAEEGDEKKLEDQEQINKLCQEQIEALNERFELIQEEINNKILPGGDSIGINAESAVDMANKLALLENEMLAIAEQGAKLFEEKEERDKSIEVILEQIDILKIVKANREDLEEALGDKADACMINRKVSHDQFDAACDDLAKGIEEALAKLSEQEAMWNQALEALQKDVGNKLDKAEVDPLRDFVNSKLKGLQDKFRALAAIKKDQEAAGTKSKFLRDVNCISCDKEVVMRKEMDSTLRPRPYGMPPARNMAPYLAYELDQLRKQKKCVPTSKNLNFLESAVKGRAVQDKTHICNRYCGGSHTVTTAQQRVTRLGHFLEQWGPEIAPLNDEYIKGTDNHMYKAREESKLLLKQESKAGPRSSKEIAFAPEGETPQEESEFVSPDAQEALTKYGDTLQIAEGSKMKVPNIGTAGFSDQAQLAVLKMEDAGSGEQISASVQQLPTPSAQQLPSASAQQIQAGSVQKIPSTTAQKIPSATVQKIPSATVQKLPSTTVQKTPSAAAQKATSVTAQKTLSVSAQKTLSASAQKTLSATAQKTLSGTAQKTLSSSAHRIPSPSSQKMRSSSAQRTRSSSGQRTRSPSTPKSPSSTAQKMPSATAQKMPSATAQKMPSATAQKMPSGSIQKMPSGSIQKMPSGSIQKMPSASAQKLSSPSAQKMEQSNEEPRSEEPTTEQNVEGSPSTQKIEE